MYKLLDCDVEDLDKLAIFRYKRNQWVEMLGGKDRHSIFKQLTEIYINDIYYRVINETRRLSIENKVNQNGRLHHLIDTGFVASQSLGIRRLTEPYTGQRNKLVISLPRILDDMEENLELITRENSLCYDGAKYDGSGNTNLDDLAELIHKNFDKLSGVTSSTRKRTDLIQGDLFKWLRKEFKKCELIRRYANKLLAHAADPENRGEVKCPTFDEFDNCYKVLSSMCNCVSSSLLYDTFYSFVAITPFDELTGLDTAICNADDLPELEKYISDRRNEMESFGDFEMPENF